jgi:hypothetical protein
MPIEHIDIRCHGIGCKCTLTLHLDLFRDVGQLAELAAQFDWIALDGVRQDSTNPVASVVVLACKDCARKMLPAECVAELDATEQAARSRMS